MKFGSQMSTIRCQYGGKQFFGRAEAIFSETQPIFFHIIIKDFLTFQIVFYTLKNVDSEKITRIEISN